MDTHTLRNMQPYSYRPVVKCQEAILKTWMYNRCLFLAAQTTRIDAAASRTPVLLDWALARVFGPVVSLRRAAARRRLTTGLCTALLSILVSPRRSAVSGTEQQTRPWHAVGEQPPDHARVSLRAARLAH